MREFRQTHGKGVDRYWKVELRGKAVYSEWGAVNPDGLKMHGHTTDIPGAKGKEGTKAFVDEAANAQFEFDRAIRKKNEEGYVEVGKGAVKGAAVVSDKIDHSKPLPKNLCFSKPLQKPPKKFMGTTKLYCTRKVNGQTVVVHKMADGSVQIYSRRMDLMTEHFPHLVMAMQDPFYKPCSILLFEGFMGEGNTHRDLLKASSIFRSKAPLATSKQEIGGWMHFYLFRVPVWGGDNVEQVMPHQDQLTWIDNIFTDKLIDTYYGKVKYMHPIELYPNLTHDQAMDKARLKGFEGFVAYVPGESLGDKSYSFHGKPDRPNHFFKIKLPEEDDFIVYWNPTKGTNERPLGTVGTGKNMGLVGTLSMYQLNSAGAEVYIGEVGTGMSDEQRKEWANPKLFPFVVEVQYDARSFLSAGDKSNALQIPRLKRVRDDKALAECTCDEL